MENKNKIDKQFVLKNLTGIMSVVALFSMLMPMSSGISGIEIAALSGVGGLLYFYPVIILLATYLKKLEKYKKIINIIFSTLYVVNIITVFKYSAILGGTGIGLILLVLCAIGIFAISIVQFFNVRGNKFADAVNTEGEGEVINIPDVELSKVTETVNGAFGKYKSKCPECGASVYGGKQFCSKCGAKIPKNKDSDKKEICPSCSKEISLGSKFCPECGCEIPEKTEMVKCNSCGAVLEENTVFCPKCGAKADDLKEDKETEESLKCNSCGAVLEEDTVFCPKCGAKADDLKEDKETEESLKCNSCGAVLEENTVFCPKCGVKNEEMKNS